MTKDPGKTLNTRSDEETASTSVAPPEVAEEEKSRRRFTRNAVMGSAVLLSLGNRAAWGSQGNPCLNTLSTQTMTSFNAVGSVSPATLDKVSAYNTELGRNNRMEVPVTDGINEEQTGTCVVECISNNGSNPHGLPECPSDG